VKRGVRETHEVELVPAQQLLEERFGVNADPGGARNQGAQIDGDPGTVLPFSGGRLLDRGDGGLSLGFGTARSRPPEVYGKSTTAPARARKRTAPSGGAGERQSEC
jgi:hypothetical protein